MARAVRDRGGRDPDGAGCVGGGDRARRQHGLPGLPAKPIIDIDVTLARFEPDRESAVVALEAMGYSYWRANPDPGHLFFVKGLPPAGAGRTHHVHVFDGPAEYERRRAFRDHLRTNAVDARRYAALKREFAARYRTDRDAYTGAKTDFVREVLSRGGG